MSNTPSSRSGSRETSVGDDVLLGRLREGDQRAYAELWRRHSGAARALAASYSTRFDVDDVVAEAFTRIYKAIQGGHGPHGGFRQYLFSTVRNIEIDWRKASRETSHDDMDVFEGLLVEDPNDNLKLDQSLTLQAFAALPVRWQEVLWYLEVERMTPQQLAPIIGVKPNAVAALAYRAREGLRQEWIQAHLQSLPKDSECRWTVERPGAYVRDGLRKRETPRGREALSTCETCPSALAEVEEVASRLTLVLLPLIVGVGAAAGYTASLVGGAHGAAPVLASDIRPIGGSSPQPTTVAPTIVKSTARAVTAQTGLPAWAVVTAAVVVLAVVGGVVGFASRMNSPTHPASPGHRDGSGRVDPSVAGATRGPKAGEPAPPSGHYTALTRAKIGALPSAIYKAVIPGLIDYDDAPTPSGVSLVATITADTPLYGEGAVGPVAKLDAKNFLNESTTVVPVRFSGDWALVITPSRQQLPSKDSFDAPAQTAGWIRRDALHHTEKLSQRVVVSISRQVLKIVNADGSVAKQFDVGVGTPNTPTPVGVTGYIQAKYLDPLQGQAVYPIQLTSLHSSAADNPYLGTDGGLIGLHFQTLTTGKVSHGCVRLAASAITAVNRLPDGTEVTFAK